jgi:ribose 5-phosphate isomerase A
VPPDTENEKKLAAQAAASLVKPRMSVGLGTGSTVHYLLPALAARDLDLRCVASSPQTEEAARRLGLKVEPFTLDRLDMAIDGADQVSPDAWLVKGAGAALTREKLIAITAEQFVVIVDSTKPVEVLGAPVPLELLAFGVESTLARLGQVDCRDAPLSPDGGVIADFVGPVGDPAALSARFESTPGVVEHGLFPPSMVTTVLVGRGDTVQTITVGH